MAADAQASDKAVEANGTRATGTPIELAISLPQSPGTKLHLQLAILAASTILFLTSTSMESGQSAASMGSFVFAMPDRYNPNQPLSTVLYTLPSSQDFTTRMARLLARKTGKPCYVGSSINLSNAAGGGSVEEEMLAFRAVVEVVLGEIAKLHG